MTTNLIDLYNDTYTDYVYDMARVYSPKETQEAVNRWSKYDSPTEPIDISIFPNRKLMITPLDGLRQSLTAIVINGYVAQYSRSDMIALWDTLEKGLVPVHDRTEGVNFTRRMKVTICDEITVELRELANRWNRLHPEEEEI